MKVLPILKNVSSYIEQMINENIPAVRLLTMVSLKGWNKRLKQSCECPLLGAGPIRWSAEGLNPRHDAVFTALVLVK